MLKGAKNAGNKGGDQTMAKADLEVLKNLSQAAGNLYDGAVDENGEPIKIGLKREEGNPILDSRTMDGFKVNIAGSNLILTYQSHLQLMDYLCFQ